VQYPPLHVVAFSSQLAAFPPLTLHEGQASAPRAHRHSADTIIIFFIGFPLGLTNTNHPLD
jgi:hypothetical protein